MVAGKPDSVMESHPCLFARTLLILLLLLLAIKRNERRLLLFTPALPYC